MYIELGDDYGAKFVFNYVYLINLMHIVFSSGIELEYVLVWFKCESLVYIDYEHSQCYI